jgi:hypothetical protein
LVLYSVPRVAALAPAGAAEDRLPDLTERGAVLTAVKDASRRSAVAFGHP